MPGFALPLPSVGVGMEKGLQTDDLQPFLLAEREAPEPTLSENIIKSQITDNHTLSTMQSKSKSF